MDTTVETTNVDISHAVEKIRADRRRKVGFTIAGLILFVGVLFALAVGAYNEPAADSVPETSAQS